MNKKIVSLGFLLLLMAVGVKAQDSSAKKDWNTNQWFIQAQGGAGYTVGEADFKDLISPAAAISIGKYLGPVGGFRLQASGLQGKGGWKNETALHPTAKYSFDYYQASADALLNLTRAFGAKETSRFDLIGILGVGYAYTDNYDKVGGLIGDIHDDAVESAVARAGLQANFWLSNNLSLNIEGMGNAINDSFNGKTGSVNDWHFNVLAGVSYNFGGKKVKTCIDESVVDELNGKINSQRKQIQDLEDALKNQKPAEVRIEEKIVTVTEKEGMGAVAFTIGSSKIATTQMVHVYNIAKFMKENPSTKVVLTGYADAGTGSKGYNQKISQARSKAVEKMLIETYGISKDRITLSAKGSEVQPFATNEWNRVVIMVAEK